MNTWGTTVIFLVRESDGQPYPTLTPQLFEQVMRDNLPFRIAANIANYQPWWVPFS